MSSRFAMLFTVVVALSACSAGRPKERINPPDVSLQEVRVDGERCSVRLRIQNHSTVGMRFNALTLDRLSLDGRELGPLSLVPDIDVPPNTGEPIDHEMSCAGMAANASELVYRLQGRIETTEPGKRRFDIEHRSRLLPVPGLTGVYR